MYYYTINRPGHGEYEEKKSRFLGEALPVKSEEEVRAALTRIRKEYYDARHHCYAYVIRPLPDQPDSTSRMQEQTQNAHVISRTTPDGSPGNGTSIVTGNGSNPFEKRGGIREKEGKEGFGQGKIRESETVHAEDKGIPLKGSIGPIVRRSSDDGEPSGTAGAPILSVIDGKDCANVLIVVTRYFGGTLLGTGGLVRAYTRAASLALADAGIVCVQEGTTLHIRLPYSLYDKILYQLRQQHIEPQHPGFGTEVSFDITVPAQTIPAISQQLQTAGSGQIRIEETGRGYFNFPQTD